MPFDKPGSSSSSPTPRGLPAITADGPLYITGPALKKSCLEPAPSKISPPASNWEPSLVWGKGHQAKSSKSSSKFRPCPVTDSLALSGAVKPPPRRVKVLKAFWGGCWGAASLPHELALQVAREEEGGWPRSSLPPLCPAGLCWDLRSCVWRLREGWLGVLPTVEEKLPRDCTQVFLFSQKFQPFKDQGPERGLGLFQATREPVFQLGSTLGLVEASLIFGWLSGKLQDLKRSQQSCGHF